MPRNVEGRRVETAEEIEQGGDYVVKYAPDSKVIAAIVFAMPGFSERDSGAPLWNRIAGQGSSDPRDRVRWEITEDEQGRVTVAPSIKAQWPEGEEGERKLFHAYLRDGTWEVLDDTAGASW
jgi:hypothetical protein